MSLDLNGLYFSNAALNSDLDICSPEILRQPNINSKMSSRFNFTNKSTHFSECRKSLFVPCFAVNYERRFRSESMIN